MKKVKVSRLKINDLFQLEIGGEVFRRQIGYKGKVRAYPANLKLHAGELIRTLHLDKDTEVFVC